VKLKSAPSFLTMDDQIVLQDVCAILRIFNLATEKISGDLYPTISLIIPLISGLFCKLNEIEKSLKTEKKWGLSFKKIGDDVIAQEPMTSFKQVMTQNGPVTAPGSHGVFRGKGVGSKWAPGNLLF
jgi:hypothetical protein